jgi:hypothetical protein
MPDTLAKFRVKDRAEAIAKFREWFLAQPELVARARRELRGKVLGCWCRPASCHGDVIAEIIDSEPVNQRGAADALLGIFGLHRVVDPESSGG